MFSHLHTFPFGHQSVQVRSRKPERAGTRWWCSVTAGTHTHTRVHPTFAEDSAAVQRSCGSNTSSTPSSLQQAIEGIH
ncbi:hypothetical protein M404DRAFT_998996 [Pisolithus tinctorius Marx 270]|uniref:Uncharacterized protein n=1 Tax=Pisolithus tinctorius Marx 270 TaxID=870435 RepID=A0A0C3PES6_PISTI|nr:hypothetical protein M404DRAFT_998996 [Pisolithus tinctorius Marx 270]